MGKALLITSGKGGVGKSTVALNLAVSLAGEGKKCVIVELDSGLRCLDLMLGIDGIVFDLGDVLSGRCDANQAIYVSEFCKGVSLVAAPAEVRFSINPERLSVLSRFFCKRYDFVIFDTPAGLGSTLVSAANASDGAVVVTNTSQVSIRDAERAAQIVTDTGIGFIRLVINRVPLLLENKESLPDFDDIIDGVGAQLIAVIPEDAVLKRCISERQDREIKKSAGIKAFSNMAKRLLGNDISLLIR